MSGVIRRALDASLSCVGAWAAYAAFRPAGSAGFVAYLVICGLAGVGLGELLDRLLPAEKEKDQ